MMIVHYHYVPSYVSLLRAAVCQKVVKWDYIVKDYMELFNILNYFSTEYLYNENIRQKLRLYRTKKQEHFIYRTRNTAKLPTPFKLAFLRGREVQPAHPTRGAGKAVGYFHSL